MSAANELRRRADDLRQALPERQTAKAPEEDGQRLATMQRGPDEEIRVTWRTYEGRPYVAIRFWTRKFDGQWWPDKGRGISIRIRELPELATAVSAAIDLAEANQREWREQQANERRRAMPGRRLDPATLPPVTPMKGQEVFDEFREG